MNADNLRGSALMVAAMVGFALSDMFIKLVSAHIPVGEIIFLLGVSGILVFAILARSRGEKIFTKEMLCAPVLWRGLGEIIGTIGFVTAIARIPLSNASAIIQAMPLLVTLGAALFFGSPVGWRRWSAIIAGMVGVLLVIRPGLSGFDFNSLFAVQGVLGLAIRDLATRAVPKGISSVQLSTFGFGVLIPTGFALMFYGATPVVPDLAEAWQVGAFVVFGLAGYYAITAAMRVGDVAIVTPYRYSRLLFALIIGYFVFGERIDALTLTGATIIILSGLYTFLRERKLPPALSSGTALG